MTGVESLTTFLSLIKSNLGHSVRDDHLASNLDLIDAGFLELDDGVKIIKGDLTAGIANSIAMAVQNPESVDCHILQVVIEVNTAGGTATAVLDVDVVASATATSDTILDGIDLDSAAISSSLNVSDSGTNGNEEVHLWNANGGANDYITGKVLVETAANLVGKYYIYYTKVA